MKNTKIWTYYKSRVGLGWAIYNNKFGYISHYESTEREAFKICMQWNRKQREF